MSVASPAEPAEESQRRDRTGALTTDSPPEPSLGAARALDGSLIVLFLTLTFLLGSFPLKDADIYWHLRTGDLDPPDGRRSPHRHLHFYSRRLALDRLALDLSGRHKLAA